MPHEKINCDISSSCNEPNGLLEQPGTSYQLNYHTLDSASSAWVCPRGKGASLAPKVGSTHPCQDSMYCKTVALSNNGAYDTVQATWEGFHSDSSNPKMPTGGAGNSTAEQPIACHPNYTRRPETWGEVFGEGASPNPYGRITDESDSFVSFGPLPDGMDGRADPINPNCENNPTDACRLMGVENFLDAGQCSYTYTILTLGEFAQTYDLYDMLGYIATPKSGEIPVPSLPNERDWLFTNITEDFKVLKEGSNGANAVTTTFQFTGSGDGGWNKLIYRIPSGGVDMNLDDYAGL
jgi:hypothetical protein